MTRRTLRPFVACLAVLVLATCGDDDGSGPDPDPTLASVTVSPASTTLDAFGATQQLSATAIDSEGETVTGATFTWSSTNEAVATVDGNGLVTAAANGTTTIQVEATHTSGSASGSAAIEVEQQAAAVVLEAPDEMLSVGQQMQLTATSTDANGNAIVGASIDFSSSDEDVATVDGDGLVTAVGAGETTLTAALHGQEDTAELSVVVGDVVFDEDTEISGTLETLDFTIAPGVTVTATGDVTINASGDVDLDGTIVGDCTAITVNGGAAMEVSGVIDNRCATEGESADLTLLGAGALTLSGIEIRPGGDVTVRNDGPAAAPVGFDGALQLPMRPCLYEGVLITAAEAPAGDPGAPGAQILFRCQNTATFGMNNQIEAQTGGPGLDDLMAGATASGADGGPGGTLFVEAMEGDLIFQENTQDQTPATVLASGDGGRGGDAEALADDTDRDADATGGDGSIGGDLIIRTFAGDITVEGPTALSVYVGSGGRGGHATATGDDGSSPSEPGGAAEATGGMGGPSGAWGIQSTESGPVGPARAITGDEHITQQGADGGAGGESTAIGGIGADGDESSPPGGRGGDMTSNGGDGGVAIDPTPLLGFGTGGAGGNALWAGGQGGHGADLCFDREGGAGGDGGDGLGSGGGNGGAGPTGGADGTDDVAAGTGDGGTGGDGEGPGAGGDGGTNGTADDAMDAWRDMGPGSGCVESLGVALTTDEENDPSGHEEFTQIAATVDELELHLLGTSVQIEGNGNWQTLTGNIDEDGNITAEGTGSAAGYTGVSFEFVGSITRDEDGMPVGITGQLTVGGNGALPGGQPVIYDVNTN